MVCIKKCEIQMFFSVGEEVAEPEVQIFQDPDPFSGASFSAASGPVHSTPAPAAPSLTEEQQRRMELNRQRALEKRLARQQQQTGESHSISCVMKIIHLTSAVDLLIVSMN